MPALWGRDGPSPRRPVRRLRPQARRTPRVRTWTSHLRGVAAVSRVGIARYSYAVRLLRGRHRFVRRAEVRSAVRGGSRCPRCSPPRAPRCTPLGGLGLLRMSRTRFLPRRRGARTSGTCSSWRTRASRPAVELAAATGRRDVQGSHRSSCALKCNYKARCRALSRKPPAVERGVMPLRITQ